MAVDQFTSQLVSLRGGGAVADADELDVMLAGQIGQLMNRLIPMTLGRMGIDGRRLQLFICGVLNRDLYACAKSGIEPKGGAGAGRCGQQMALVQIHTCQQSKTQSLRVVGLLYTFRWSLA